MAVPVLDVVCPAFILVVIVLAVVTPTPPERRGCIVACDNASLAAPVSPGFRRLPETRIEHGDRDAAACQATAVCRTRARLTRIVRILTAAKAMAIALQLEPGIVVDAQYAIVRADGQPLGRGQLGAHRVDDVEFGDNHAAGCLDTGRCQWRGRGADDIGGTGLVLGRRCTARCQNDSGAQREHYRDDSPA